MTMPDKFRLILEDLCIHQPLAVLATAADAHPYTNLVAVAFDLNLKNLYFATPRSTRKWHNLKNNPQVSLLIDNRSNQVIDFSRAAAATVVGEAGELSGAARDAGEDLYLAKHPHLKDFITSPDCALFGVSVSRIFLVTHFQEVVEFDFSIPATTVQ